MVSFAAVRDEGGKVLGAMVLGRPLDDMLSRTGEPTGNALFLAAVGKTGAEVLGRSSQTDAPAEEALGPAKELIARAIDGNSGVLRLGNRVVSAAALEAIGEGKRGAVVVTSTGRNGDGGSSMYLAIFRGHGAGIDPCGYRRLALRELHHASDQ